ncbi:unnamed protein product [Cuscuta campestris]|uniref:Reverse transcriptase domain-containing protein n=1 Tax=Cuscuta campestris TaxID=132261 RepID=A0A484LWW4_9ASTE|nr:unnamed protein product [Cuscuta campestris]
MAALKFPPIFIKVDQFLYYQYSLFHTVEWVLHYYTDNSSFTYHPMCKSYKLVNLVFADDLIVVSKADEKSVNCIFKALKHFSLTTGLHINQAKSQIVTGGVRKEIETRILELTNIPKGDFPFRYLGRARLINSVLYGVIFFWTRIFIIPNKKVSQWAGTDLTARNIKEMEDKINILYGRVEFHDGVCIAYDHVDEILKTLHLFRHLLDLPYSDSELYAFNVEIYCSIQDLVRGTPMALSDIPLELKSFKTKMMDAIRNLLGVPIAPLDLAPSATLHNPTSKDMESVERTIRNSVRVLEVADDGVSVEGIVNAFPLDLVVVETPVDAPGKGEVAKDQTLCNAIIACSLVPPFKTTQVADVNYTQADISLSFDIIQTSDHANKVESEYWVSPRAAKFVFALLAYAHRYTPICRLNEDLTSSGHSLWVIIFSPGMSGSLHLEDKVVF